MPKVIFIAADGVETVIEIAPGQTLLLGALENGVAGIDWQCGGTCACATCQVIVEDNWAGRLSPPSAMEESLLDYAPNAGPNSRLACQIRMDDGLEGLRVRLV
jgi:2Fe-2S ferredoxin